MELGISWALHSLTVWVVGAVLNQTEVTFGIIELWKGLTWKGPQRSSSSNPAAMGREPGLSNDLERISISNNKKKKLIQSSETWQIKLGETCGLHRGSFMELLIISL